MFHQRHIGVVVAVMTAAGSYAAVAQTTTAPAPATTAAADATVAQTASDFRSSKLVGTTVYNGANENIGEIEDLIIDSKGAVSNVVIGVGGFLGMGEKNVALPFTSLKTMRDDGGRIKVVVDGTKESLKAMPTYTYLKS